MKLLSQSCSLYCMCVCVCECLICEIIYIFFFVNHLFSSAKTSKSKHYWLQQSKKLWLTFHLIVLLICSDFSWRIWPKIWVVKTVLSLLEIEIILSICDKVFRQKKDCSKFHIILRLCAVGFECPLMSFPLYLCGSSLNDMTTVSKQQTVSQINRFIFLKVFWLISVDVHLWHPII